MSYLALLKQLEGGEIFTHTPETVLTKPTQPGFVSCVSPISGGIEKNTGGSVSCVSSILWGIEKINAANDALENTPETPSTAASYPAGLPTVPDTDDRRTCSQCRNLASRVCSVARPGGTVSAIKGYRPDLERLRRCAGYLPNGSDADPRPGAERWPG